MLRQARNDGGWYRRIDELKGRQIDGGKIAVNDGDGEYGLYRKNWTLSPRGTSEQGSECLLTSNGQYMQNYEANVDLYSGAMGTVSAADAFLYYKDSDIESYRTGAGANSSKTYLSL